MKHDTRRQVRRSRGMAAAWGRLPFALAALLALLTQALAIQTHVHPREPTTAHARTVPGVAADHHHGRRSTAPIDCPSCRQLADAAAYLTPASPAVVAPHRWTVPLPARGRTMAASGGRSHAWRSRGPPGSPAASIA